MFEFLLFVVATVGLTAILVDGKIFAFFREKLFERARFLREKRERLKLRPNFTFTEFFEGILTCYQCCGFWSGLLCGLFLVVSFTKLGPDAPRLALVHTLLLWFCCGAAGSVLAHVYYWCIELISALTLLVKSQIETGHHHHHDHHEDDAGQYES